MHVGKIVGDDKFLFYGNKKISLDDNYLFHGNKKISPDDTVQFFREFECIVGR